MKIRLVNTTASVKPPGHFLDFGGKLIAPGKFELLDVIGIDSVLESWANQGLVQIRDAQEGTLLASAPNVETYKQPVQTVAASELDLEEDDFDLSEAKEAVLPNQGTEQQITGIMQSTAQSNIGEVPARVRISPSLEDRGPESRDPSPIPGEKPRSIDDSDKFTIRAPRTQGVGAVISTAKS